MKRRKILVVNDEPEMRIFLTNLLEPDGYVLIVAENFMEGIKKAREMKPELIILDAMIPNEDGMQLYRQLKVEDKLKGIPVIMLSDVGKKSFFRSRGLLAPNLRNLVPEPEVFIEKPPESDEILGWARNLLEKK